MEGYHYYYPLRVRYSEIDGQKIVFNAHYMTYIDCAVSEYYREGLQFNLLELAEEGAYDFVLAKSTLEFKQSAFLHDLLNIWCRTKKIGRTSITKEFVITRDGENEAILNAEVIYVSIDPKTLKPQPVPDFVRERIAKLEKREFPK